MLVLLEKYPKYTVHTQLHAYNHVDNSTKTFAAMAPLATAPFILMIKTTTARAAASTIESENKNYQ